MSCDVLLSVYGATEFLKPFLDSLAMQRDAAFRLLYRFDGEPEADALRLLTAFPGSQEVSGRIHLGVVGSYRELLRASDADAFCLADQDDVWQADKLSVLTSELASAERCFGRETPLLLHSDLRVVDRGGRVVAPSFLRYQSLDPRRRSLRDLLVQNNVTGCAALGNRALREQAREIPHAAVCHDWYLALAAAAFGRIVFVDRALVDYRQHEGNAIGAAPRRRVLLEGLRRSSLHGRLVATQRQAAAFLVRQSSRLSAEQRRVASAWAELSGLPYCARLRELVRFGFRKNDWLRTLGMLWAL